MNQKPTTDETIHIWNLPTYDTQPIKTQEIFLMKFLVNFQRKRVEIPIIYECNLKIVKICPTCADFEWLTLRKAAQNRKSSSNRTSC